MYDDLPKTRAEAIAAGAPRYFTGVACRKGHIAPRQASSCACTKCRAARSRSVWDTRRETQRQVSRNSMRRQRARDPLKFRDREAAYRRGNPVKLMLLRAKYRARDLGLPFDLVEADIVIPLRCPYFPWITIEGGLRVVRDSSPALDRIIPALGYVRGNIEVISHRANTIKSNGTADEHRRIADRMEQESFLA